MQKNDAFFFLFQEEHTKEALLSKEKAKLQKAIRQEERTKELLFPEHSYKKPKATFFSFLCFSPQEAQQIDSNYRLEIMSLTR
jgi:hypothetical protein